MRQTSLICLLALVPLLLSAGKKKAIPEYRRPGLSFEAPVTVVAAHRACENYAWAAALESLLAAQHVNLDQEYWVDKADGGRCTETAADLEQTARLVDGEYTLPAEDGAAKARLTTTVSLGAPAVGEALVSLKRGRAVMVLWNEHPYVLKGAVYDEYVQATGERRFVVHELRLFDPAAGGKAVVFRAEKDDPAAITGTLSIEVVFCPMNTITCP